MDINKVKDQSESDQMVIKGLMLLATQLLQEGVKIIINNPYMTTDQTIEAINIFYEEFKEIRDSINNHLKIAPTKIPNEEN